MAFCPWCGGRQDWGAGDYEGVCAHCSLGVDDGMSWCPWCGRDATGNDLIRPALDRAATLLSLAGVPGFGYRVLLRPGVSGVDPAWPRIVEINRGLVRRRGMPPGEWDALTGLLVHEIGHSFLYHHMAWARSETFRLVFGDVDTPYDVPDTVDVEFGSTRFSRLPPTHASHYGQYHPQEDFAETFRYYVLLGGHMAEIEAERVRAGKITVVAERFRVLDEYLRGGGRAGPQAG